jgi:hypothetical protein
MKVKLAEGRALRDPTTKHLMKPDDVRDVPDGSLYWRRRLRDGDVVRVDAPPPDKPARHSASAKE